MKIIKLTQSIVMPVIIINSCYSMETINKTNLYDNSKITYHNTNDYSKTINNTKEVMQLDKKLLQEIKKCKSNIALNEVELSQKLSSVLNNKDVLNSLSALQKNEKNEYSERKNENNPDSSNLPFIILWNFKSIYYTDSTLKEEIKNYPTYDNIEEKNKCKTNLLKYLKNNLKKNSKIITGYNDFFANLEDKNAIDKAIDNLLGLLFSNEKTVNTIIWYNANIFRNMDKFNRIRDQLTKPFVNQLNEISNKLEHLSNNKDNISNNEQVNDNINLIVMFAKENGNIKDDSAANKLKEYLNEIFNNSETINKLLKSNAKNFYSNLNKEYSFLRNNLFYNILVSTATYIKDQFNDSNSKENEINLLKDERMKLVHQLLDVNTIITDA